MEIVEFVVRYLGQVIRIVPSPSQLVEYAIASDGYYAWQRVHPGEVALYLRWSEETAEQLVPVTSYSEAVEVAIDRIVSRDGRGKRFPEVPVVEITHRPSGDNVAWLSPVTEQLVLLHDPETEESSWCHNVYNLFTMDYRFTRLPGTFLSADVLFYYKYATIEDFLDKLCMDYER